MNHAGDCTHKGASSVDITAHWACTPSFTDLHALQNADVELFDGGPVCRQDLKTASLLTVCRWCLCQSRCGSGGPDWPQGLASATMEC